MRRWGAWVLVAVAVVCFWQAGERQQPLVQMRRDLGLSKGDPLENSPPLVAFTTVALGGFRGIIADLLWLRSSQLQQDGKYFELVQLADWITKLEPRMSQVWAFHGWNMAYNVSVLFSDPADRWRWVRQGITLLRDEGLRYNPGEPNLYRELGWIYQHKLSGNTDQMNVYYRRQWAEEMGTLFDGPRPDYTRYVAGSPDVADRVKRMKEVYRLDPAVMQEVDRQFGPLDWRLPQAHAIYWAYRGRRYAQGFESAQIDRMIFQSLADAALQGSLFSNMGEDVFMTGPNLAIFPKARRAYEDAMAANPDESSIRSAYRNFLRTSIIVLYTHNRLADAQELYADLRARYPEPQLGPELDAYVYRRMTEFVADIGQREANTLVLGTLQQSWFWLAMGDLDRAEGFQMLARTIYRGYMRDKTTPELVERTGLPPFDQLNAEASERVRSNLASPEAKQRLSNHRF